MTVRTELMRRTVTSFVHPPSLNVGTTAAFPATGFVTAPMTVVMVQMRTRNANPRLAVLKPSSVPAPTCVCLNAGSVMETKTVLMELMRVSRLAACTPTARVMITSSCARTESVSPSTLCVITTLTAPMALMNPQSVNTQHVVQKSSAVPTAAASTRRNGSVTESLTVRTALMKLPRTHAALTQRGRVMSQPSCAAMGSA